jgi:hypothetical protein
MAIAICFGVLLTGEASLQNFSRLTRASLGGLPRGGVGARAAELLFCGSTGNYYKMAPALWNQHGAAPPLGCLAELRPESVLEPLVEPCKKGPKSHTLNM